MLLGEHEHTIDDKGRLTIPAKIRGQLTDGLVVTKGIDPCLWLYPSEVWANLAQKINALPVTDPKSREFQRQVFGTAAASAPDSHGRVTLPQTLRQYADIDKHAVVIGLFDHCEIWSLERWRERQERSDSDPDGRAEQFASLGI